MGRGYELMASKIGGRRMKATTAALQSHPKTAIKPRQRQRRATEKIVPPTPETVLKLKPNFLMLLADDPRTQPLALAAEQICRAFNTIWVRSLARAGSLEPRVDGRREAEDYPPKLRPLVHRYHAWVDEIDRRKLPLDWIIAMIVDGMAPAEVDWRAHWQDGHAADRLIEALALYCRMG